MTRDSKSEQYTTKAHDPQCTWETGEDRCRMAAGVTTGGRGVCGWHYQAQSWMYDPIMRGKVTDRKAFEEWVAATRSTYGFFSVSVVWCKHTVQSLWDAVRGVQGQLRVDPLWAPANDIVFTKKMTDEGATDYKQLWGDIKGLSPIDWRAQFAKLGEQYGVEMAVPPMAEKGAKQVAKPVALKEERGQTEAEAMEVKRTQQEQARQMGLIDDGNEEVPF